MRPFSFSPPPAVSGLALPLECGLPEVHIRMRCLDMNPRSLKAREVMAMRDK